MEDECKRAVDKIKESLIKAELVRLFQSNPYIMDNLRGLSRWLGISDGLVAPEVEEMVTLRILQRYGDEPGAVYSYTRNTRMMMCIERNWPEIEQARAELRKREMREEL